MGRLFLYGASGHAKVVRDILQQNGDEDFILLDDNPKIKKLNGDHVFQLNEVDVQPKDKFLIAVGINETRKEVSKKISNQFFSVIHPHAQINTKVDIGDGSMVAAGVVINSDSKVGNHCIINTASSIDHDCVIGNFVHIAPGVTICGGVMIGEGTLVGAGATILPNVKIGAWVTVGAGAAVTKDIPDHTTVVGVPAKRINK